MNDYGVTCEEINHMVETLNTFTKMAKNIESFSKTNSEIQLALKCARAVENIYSALRNEHLQYLFIQQMCKTVQEEEDSYDISTMEYACDSMLEAVFTSNCVPASSLLCFINNYIELCGKDRFTQLMSVIIVRSEACRVLLDYIGTMENNSQTNIMFQASLLLRILSENENEATVVNSVYSWLNSNEESRIHVTFQAITEAGLCHNISAILIKELVAVLGDRKEAAVLYWSTVTSSPLCVNVLKESRSLFYASLDFLAKCADNFQQTAQFKWVSHENGPCQIITFEMIIKYIQFLKSADYTLANLVDTFIGEKCSLPGCTFWEDILDSFPL